MRRHQRPRPRFWTDEAVEILLLIAAICAAGAVAALALSR